jgi:hypothetical protein
MKRETWDSYQLLMKNKYQQDKKVKKLRKWHLSKSQLNATYPVTTNKIVKNIEILILAA